MAFGTFKEKAAVTKKSEKIKMAFIGKKIIKFKRAGLNMTK